MVDGGIRSGSDVFKMLALGAEAVLIGRPVVIATVAFGRMGVYALLKNYLDELKHIMSILGLENLTEIRRNHIQSIR